MVKINYPEKEQQQDVANVFRKADLGQMFLILVNGKDPDLCQKCIIGTNTYVLISVQSGIRLFGDKDTFEVLSSGVYSIKPVHVEINVSQDYDDHKA